MDNDDSIVRSDLLIRDGRIASMGAKRDIGKAQGFFEDCCRLTFYYDVSARCCLATAVRITRCLSI